MEHKQDNKTLQKQERTDDKIELAMMDIKDFFIFMIFER